MISDMLNASKYVFTKQAFLRDSRPGNCYFFPFFYDFDLVFYSYRFIIVQFWKMADYYAVGQCTPGVIAVNTATFIGMKRKGIPGGITATLGVVFPSLVIITVIAAFLSNFAQIQFVKDAFAGIRVRSFSGLAGRPVRDRGAVCKKSRR